jgi:hypothetical protein
MTDLVNPYGRAEQLVPLGTASDGPLVLVGRDLDGNLFQRRFGNRAMLDQWAGSFEARGVDFISINPG